MKKVSEEFISIRDQIKELSLLFDPIELLSRISLLTNFVPVENTDLNANLRQLPILYMLTALCLQNDVKQFGVKIPETKDLEQIVDLIEKLFITFNLEQIAIDEPVSSHNDSDSIILAARLQKMMGDINASAYYFQSYNLSVGIFTEFN